MTLQEAILDPTRPLTTSPNDWMNKVATNLIDQDRKTTEAIIAKSKKEKDNSTNDENGVAMVDNGLDMIIQGIELCDDGLALTKRADLKPAIRTILTKVKDILDNAIMPYTSDMVQEMDKLEEDES